MPDNQEKKQRFYPLKPKNREGFKKAVAWLGGRELIASMKGVIIYAIYGENMDPRSWMKANIYPNVEEKVKFQKKESIINQIAREVQSPASNSQKNIPEYQKLNSVIDTQAVMQVKKDPEIQKEISKKIDEEWTKKIFDQWEWKRSHYRFWENYLPETDFWKDLNPEPETVEVTDPDTNQQEQKTIAGQKKIKEFWFDYIADTGDGQLGVYSVGCMCFSDLWLTESEDKADARVQFEPPENDQEKTKFKLLPRGSYLFIGGDTAYHTANHATLFERFQTPLHWAFMSVRKFASKTYVLKRTATEKFFLLDGTRKDIFKPGTIEPIDEWDGTIGNYIDGKLYWDTEPLRPLFGVPANHDYYDSIDGFNKQFRRPPFEEIEENMVYEDDKGRMFLQIPTFSREQEASYMAIHLPFDWWLFGIDSENEKLDYRQELFFKQIMKRKPKKLIITTPEPTTVFGKISDKRAKTANYLRTITASLGLRQPFLTDGNFEILPPDRLLNRTGGKNTFEKQLDMETEDGSPDNEFSPNDRYCRLDISGDIHHYARYWGPNARKFEGSDFWSPNYASLVAGGGGAFFDSTETLIGKTYDSNDKRIRKDGLDNEVKGEIPPQKVFPNETASLNRMSERLFDLWNIKKGGYVQLGGAVVSVIIYFLLVHFSNASERFLEIDGKIKAKGLFYAVGDLNIWFQRLLESRISEYGNFVAGVFLTAVAALLFSSARKLNQLIKDLRERSFQDRLDEGVDGTFKQLLRKFIPFLAALLLYPFFLITFGITTFGITTLNIEPLHTIPFTKSYFLLVHFVITGLLIWLSMDYANWLPVSFKITRNSTEKTYIQKVEDPNETATKWYEPILGFYSREFSFRYIPSNILVILAIAALILGIGVCSKEDFSKIFGDLILMIVVLGGFAVIVKMLAVDTGAAYHDEKHKTPFYFIGIFHALLQLFTPFIIYYYTNVWYFLFLIVIMIVANGFQFTSSRLKTIPFLKNPFNEKSLFYRITDFQGAAHLMRRGKMTLTICWIIYGSLFLFVPLFIPKLVSYFSNQRIESQSVSQFIASVIAQFFPSTIYPNLSYIMFLTFSIAFVAYFGHWLSRVWFSWYLAVSLAYNGHNNEAGGAARIEGFKHILRIKVEEEKLTVYVIGFDNAEHDLKKLKLKLVDKFTLKSKPIL